MTHEYAWQIITADPAPFGSEQGWGLVAQQLIAAASHLESLGWEIVSTQPVNPSFGFIFYRREKGRETTIGVTRDDIYFDGDSSPLREAAPCADVIAIYAEMRRRGVDVVVDEEFDLRCAHGEWTWHEVAAEARRNG